MYLLLPLLLFLLVEPLPPTLLHILLYKNLHKNVVLFQIKATKLVGPLTVKTPSPLPQDLGQFIRGAGDKGIILFSLGTLGDAVLQEHEVQMLTKAFGRLEQRIIWRLNGMLKHYMNSRLR